jgi:hypothetical protein
MPGEIGTERNVTLSTQRFDGSEVHRKASPFVHFCES